jgi:hypothetical protein
MHTYPTLGGWGRGGGPRQGRREPTAVGPDLHLHHPVPRLQDGCCTSGRDRGGGACSEADCVRRGHGGPRVLRARHGAHPRAPTFLIPPSFPPPGPGFIAACSCHVHSLSLAANPLRSPRSLPGNRPLYLLSRLTQPPPLSLTHAPTHPPLCLGSASYPSTTSSAAAASWGTSASSLLSPLRLRRNRRR